MVDRHITQLEFFAHLTLASELGSKSHLLSIWALLSPCICGLLWSVTDGEGHCRQVLGTKEE